MTFPLAKFQGTKSFFSQIPSSPSQIPHLACSSHISLFFACVKIALGGDRLCTVLLPLLTLRPVCRTFVNGCLRTLFTFLSCSATVLLSQIRGLSRIASSLGISTLVCEIRGGHKRYRLRSGYGGRFGWARERHCSRLWFRFRFRFWITLLVFFSSIFTQGRLCLSRALISPSAGKPDHLPRLQLSRKVYIERSLFGRSTSFPHSSSSDNTRQSWMEVSPLCYWIAF